MVNILAEYQHVGMLKALVLASSRPQTAAGMAVDSCYDPHLGFHFPNVTK